MESLPRQTPFRECRRRLSRWRLGSNFTIIFAMIAFVASVMPIGPAATASSPLAAAAPEIVVLSNRADLVSGGDALVEVRLPDGTDAGDVRVLLDGRDVTHEFALRPNGRYMGLVTGLREGDNELVARVSKRSAAALTVTNHSKQGPIFAGKQVQPWICGTAVVGLEPGQGPSCEAPTRYFHYYKSSVTGQFEEYDPSSPPSAAVVAQTKTDQGHEVPYTVRVERGVIDRGIYQVAYLYDPTRDWKPWSRQRGWNGKLYWEYLGGCNPKNEQHEDAAQDSRTTAGQNPLRSAFVGDLPLSRGYAMAVSSLTRARQNCNDVVAAEAVMMIKEHLVERYGPIRSTVGLGCSAGSMYVHLLAANYPGLLDGIIPLCSAPDMWEAMVHHTDCDLLGRYFNETSSPLWGDPTDRIAVQGSPNALCLPRAEATSAAYSSRPFLDPTVGCTASNAEEWIYDPATNRDGVRCTVQDYQAPVFGYRDADGFANSPLDNVGIQYGLTALGKGQITAEQFVDLNAQIGGRDIDYNWTAVRTEADPAGMRNLYRSGRVAQGHQLAKVPIIDVRGSSDYEEHQSVYTQAMRARLIAANGNADNHVSWTTIGAVSTPVDPEVTRGAFMALDQWLADIEADTSDDALEVKVARNKPTNATDSCWLAGRPDACGQSLPHFQTPRLVAGRPLDMLIHKCQLKPVDWADYPVEFTDGQKEQLRSAFPEGVCDWTKPGVEQQAPTGSWQSFTTTPGGQPLGPQPRSTPFTGKG